jgi:hypothetical protein
VYCSIVTSHFLLCQLFTMDYQDEIVDCWRVKLYQLNCGEIWQDQGTGFVSCHVSEYNITDLRTVLFI